MVFGIIFILILLYTGWLPTLAKESRYSANTIYFFLLTMLMTSFFSWFRLHERLWIHVSWLLLLVACICLFYQIRAYKRGWFLSVVLSSASIAFSFHEIFHLHTDWTQLSFRVLLLLLFVCGGLLAYRTWVERICYLWSGLIVTDVMILCSHQDMLNPIIIGEQDFLDTCWLLLLFLMLAHFGLRGVPSKAGKER